MYTEGFEMTDPLLCGQSESCGGAQAKLLRGNLSPGTISNELKLKQYSRMASHARRRFAKSSLCGILSDKRISRSGV